MSDISQDLQQQVSQAVTSQSPLSILGSGSKQFLFKHDEQNQLHVNAHTGVINYEPTELVLTARAGTTLSEIEALLQQHQQMLGFEPPRFSDSATLGGTIACNLSGPRRPFAGAARDFTLGCHILNGHSDILHFGGEVMKNVAGYDVSRLMAGAFGTLGVLLDISIRVLPLPETEMTVSLECNRQEAIQTCIALRQKAIPVSAACHVDQQLFVRFSGNAMAVKQAVQQTGGDILQKAASFWHSIREQQHDFFLSQKPLWRISVPPASSIPELKDHSLLDWGGGLYWFFTNKPAEQVKAIACKTGGHATLFRNSNDEKHPFAALDPLMLKLQKRLKQAFDPACIFNPDLFNKSL